MAEQPAEATRDSETLARILNEAREDRKPILPLSESVGLSTVEQAYAIQSAWSELRLEDGEQVLGRKIGLTSKAMQEQFGVDEPDFGSLWSSRFFPTESGRVEMPTDLFIEPRLEGEIAFLLEKPLMGPGVTSTDVLVATDAVAVAVEVVDSRIEDWRIKLVDTIADNASYGGFTTGPWSYISEETDLRTVGMLISRNGNIEIEGIGAAALGDPANSVAWLANRLASFDTGLNDGEVILSGSLGRALPIHQGDEFVLEAHGHPAMTVAFV